MASEVSLSELEILNLIKVREQSKKFVWTAGRVLMASGKVGYWRQVDSDSKKALLKDLLKKLEKLESQGLLIRRDLPQGIGFGDEIGFEFIRDGHSRTSR